jgi:hypothetical protein
LRHEFQVSLEDLSYRLGFRLNGQPPSIAEVTEDIIITTNAVHSVQPLWNCALQVGPSGLGLRLSTFSGCRLWAKGWFRQPTTLRASRNRDSSDESARNRCATLSEVMGVTLDAQFSDQEIDDFYVFPLV